MSARIVSPYAFEACDEDVLAKVDAAMAADALPERADSESPPPVTQTRIRACTQADHERRKRESQFPKLSFVGIQDLGGVLLELRNCPCGSTLAKEAKR